MAQYPAAVPTFEQATDYTGTGTYGTTLTIGTDFIVCPANALSDYPARPITELEIAWSSSSYFPTGMENTVQVTAKFGWPDVPDDVNKACLVQAARLLVFGYISTSIIAILFGIFLSVVSTFSLFLSFQFCFYVKSNLFNVRQIYFLFVFERTDTGRNNHLFNLW